MCCAISLPCMRCSAAYHSSRNPQSHLNALSWDACIAGAQAAMSSKLRAMQQEQQSLSAACNDANQRSEILSQELRETQAALAAQRRKADEERCALHYIQCRQTESLQLRA